MKMWHPQIAAGARRALVMVSQRLHVLARTLSHEVRKELRRLNSARLGRDELSRLAPRERTRAVKAALATHHEGSSRCC